ncbi:hypothetical protein GWK47_035428 [Chionoecetes opilio]|uniref:Transmembrane protein n=1 Tax=Chionoecetes opilio TaxID=41210 RepID=A0A8J4YFH6_CHIOP|nr:hypothetical protein GWK47_035428 [Chionoecetes opilio]
MLLGVCAVGQLNALKGSAVSIPVNAAMIYVACRLIFLVTQRSFPNQLALHDLHQCVARMVALTVLGFSTWVASVAWLAELQYESYFVYHACNYGFVISMIVAGLAGGILTSCSRNDAIQMQAGPQRYMMPQSQPQSQGHSNQAYAPPYGQQYR